MFPTLSGELASLIDERIASGKYASKDEVLLKAVRLLHHRDEQLKQLQQELAPAIERLDRGEGMSLDVESIKAEGRRRLSETGDR